MVHRAVFTGGTAVGLKQINQNQVAVFPNPASTNLTIQVKDGGVYQANIVDLQGRTVLNSTVTAEQATLNVSELNNGLYFLVLTDSFGNSSQNRLVIAQ